MSRFYLAGFADSDGRLVQVHVPGNRRHFVSINDATVIKDFYSVDLGDGELSSCFESLFAEIEGTAATALRQIIQDNIWPLPPDGKAALAAWIALQHLRSASVRTSQLDMQAHMIRLLVGTSGKEALREKIEDAEGITVGDVRLSAEWTDLTQRGGPRMIADPMDHMRTVIEMLPGTGAMLAAAHWSLWSFERRVLLTTDHPVALLRAPGHPDYMGIGLVTAGGFAIALSRRLGLVIMTGDDTPDHAMSGTTKMASAINANVAMNARRSLFVHPDDESLMDSVPIPPVREHEIGPAADDHFIREEGLFAGVPPEGLEALTPPAGLEGDGMTFDDLPWPIPGRAYIWSPADTGDGVEQVKHGGEEGSSGS